MKKKNSIILSTLLSAILLTTSCSDMDELNRDANSTTKVSAELLCTNVLLKIGKPGGDAKSFIASNALPKYVAYATEGAMAEQYNRLGAADFSIYSILPNLDDMVKYSQGTDLESAYKGVYHFSRAYMLYGLTMRMGDVPFSKANQASSGNITPAYDTQEQNFIDVLNELEAAQKAFGEAAGKSFRGDIFYEGNTDKWAKATNSFALKVLMTLSKKTNVQSLDIINRFKTIVNRDVLLTSNSENLALVYKDASNRFHPLYNQQKFTGVTMLSSLLVDNLKALNDNRIFYFGEPAGSKITEGLTASDMDAYVGIDVSTSYENVNIQYNAKTISMLNERYAKLHGAEPYNLVSYAEQNFVIAEAIELGWISGNSQEYYEEGVKNALKQLAETDATYAHGKAIDDTYIQNYFNGEAAYKNNKSDRLKQIWIQRYILHFMQDPTSSFFEYRRNEYPAFPVDPATNMNETATDKIPVRWLYPTVETNKNKENLTEALIRQFGIPNDDINNVMWLLNNN